MKISKTTWMIGLCILLGIVGFVLGSSGVGTLPAFITCAFTLIAIVWTLAYAVGNTYYEQMMQNNHYPRKVQLVITKEDCDKHMYHYDEICPLAQAVRKTLQVPEEIVVSVGPDKVLIDGVYVGDVWPWFTLAAYNRVKLGGGPFTTTLEFKPKRKLWYEKQV